MDRAEAIDVLNFYRNCHYTEALGTEERELADAINEILPHYVALREQEQSKWISDRLPTEEESERVIIGVANGDNGRITFTDAEIFVKYDFEEKVWWSVDYNIEGCEVKYWYVLPEPPKEGADNG